MDTPSAFLIAVIAIFANGALLMMMRSQLAADTLVAARSWLTGTVMIGVGVILFLYPVLLPDFLELVIPNVLVLGGLFCYTVALRQFYLLRASYRPLPFILLFVACSIYVFHWISPDFKARVLIVSLVWFPILGDAFFTLHHQRLARRSPAELALHWLYGLVLAGVVIRLGYYLWASIPVTFRITDNMDWMNRLTPILAILLPTIGTSSFMLMCYHRQYHHVQRQSLTDPLTGLGNRAMLLSLAVSENTGDDARARTYGAVLLIDLDGFKVINDTYGHAAGDEILVEVSRRLQRLVRPQDTVLRLGGDEFAIIVDGHLSSTAGHRLAERVQKAIAGRYEGNDDQAVLELGASVGLALAGNVLPPGAQSSRTLNELIGLADRAMYDAKRNGGGYRLIGHV